MNTIKYSGRVSKCFSTALSFEQEKFSRCTTNLATFTMRYLTFDQGMLYLTNQWKFVFRVQVANLPPGLHTWILYKTGRWDITNLTSNRLWKVTLDGTMPVLDADWIFSDSGNELFVCQITELPKKLYFLWDYTLNIDDIFQIFRNIRLQDTLSNLEVVNLDCAFFKLIFLQ